jgi:hypothetical protein
VFILLHLDNAAVLEGPLHDICLVAGALDMLGFFNGGPESVELGQLDEMPHMRKRRLDDSTLNDLVGRSDGLSTGGSHFWIVGS